MASETLEELVRAIGIKQGIESCRSLTGVNNFQQGLSEFVRLLIAQGRWTTPALAAYIVSLLGSKNSTKVAEVAVIVFIEAFNHSVKKAGLEDLKD